MKSFFVFGFLALISIGAYAQIDEALNNKGVDLINANKYKEALPIFDELVNKAPDNTIYRSNRAVVLFNLKQFKRALSDYKILSKEVPEESENFFQVGNIYEEFDSLIQADSFYTKALALEQDNFMYFFKRGTVYVKQEKWNQAIQDLSKAVELNPEHHNSYHNRGIAYYKSGLIEKGCIDWCDALMKGNTKSAVHLEKNCEKYPSNCLLKK